VTTLLKNFENLVEKCADELGEETKFDKLLNTLVKHGVDEEEALTLIADCLEERLVITEVTKNISEVYRYASKEEY